MAEQNETTPLLDLKTLVERPTIVIDGEPYEILSPDELTIVDSHRFAVWGARIEKLMTKKVLTKLQKKELGKILGDLSNRIMVGVPEDLRAKLSDGQRMAVAEVFTRLPLQQRLARLAAGAKTDGQNPTGASSSRGSSTATAASPDGGSSAAPSPSSEPTSP